jgi:hypothetical protein
MQLLHAAALDRCQVIDHPGSTLGDVKGLQTSAKKINYDAILLEARKETKVGRALAEWPATSVTDGCHQPVFLARTDNRT